MIPLASDVALKEWAVTVQTLGQGGQILLLRKGGIHEDGKEFRVLHSQFLLFPTYEHQRPDLIKESRRRDLQSVLTQGPNLESICFTHWAQVEEVIELLDEAAVSRLFPYHIWTDDYVQKRLRWKPRKSLALMLLRTYSFSPSQEVTYSPRYGGCKSWVRLESKVSLKGLTPVMSDQAFHCAVSKIKDSLARPLVR